MYDLVNKKFHEFLNYLPNNEIGNVDLNKVDTKKINRTIMELKSRNKINNIQYSMIAELRSYIAQYQNYKFVPALERISTILDNYIDYSSPKESISSNKESVDINNKKPMDSFKKMISRLSVTSKESIVNAKKFEEFSSYMHVERRVEITLLEECEKLNETNSGLILLVGSVGDGKSHLLSYLNDSRPDLFEDVIIHNDATESNSPHQTANETLYELLKKHYDFGQKLIIAVNIGMLQNFTTYLNEKNLLPVFRNFIDESEIFNTESMKINESKSSFRSEEFSNHSIVSFLGEQALTIENGNMVNEFYSELIAKIFTDSQDNPIYNAFINDDGFNRHEPIYANYRILLDKNIQKSLLFLLNLIRVKDKRILTVRSVLNFLYDIIVPNEKSNISYQSLLTTLLFENSDKSKLLESISLHDPSQQIRSWLETLNVQIYNTNDLTNLCERLFKENYKKISDVIHYLSGLNTSRIDNKYKTIIRFYFLFNHEKFVSKEYSDYLNLIDDIQNNNRISQRNFLKKLEESIYKWNGSPEDGYIYKSAWESKDLIRIGLELNFKFKSINISRSSILIEVIDDNLENKYLIEVDYPLYQLINKISEGYVLKNSDRSDAVNFNEFIDEILEKSISIRNTIIKFNDTNRMFKISRGAFIPEIEELRT